MASFLPVVYADSTVTVTPSSLTLSLTAGQSTSQTFSISVTTENVSDVQVVTVGNTSENETILRQMISVYPTYFARVDNSENKTFTATVNTSGVSPGIYSGYFSLTGLGKTIPISITVTRSDNQAGSGLIPSKGRIVAVMSRSHTLERQITVTNLTGYPLTSFDAYMEDTQLYGEEGLDWIVVTFEVPSVISDGSSVQVNVSVAPREVPIGTHDRTLAIEAYHDNVKVTASIGFRITVYGPEPADDNISISLANNRVKEGETVTVTASGDEVRVYMDGTLKGTTSGGSLTFTASSKGVHTLSFRVDNREISTANLTVYESKALTVSLDAKEFPRGEKITGSVTSGGSPVPDVSVSVGEVTAYTADDGSFELQNDFEDGSHVLYAASKRDDTNYIWYGSGSSSFKSYTTTSIIPMAGAIVFIILFVILLIRYRREIRDKLSSISYPF